MKDQLAIQQLLRSSFVEAQSKNPRYSMRAHALRTGVHVGTLSYVMNGKRNVSKKLAEKITRKLLIDPQKRSEILELFPKGIRVVEKVSPKYLELEASQFKMLADWEHYGLLSLMNCSDFKAKSEWIAKRLGISTLKADETIQRLLDVGVIKRQKNNLERIVSKVRSSDDTINLSLRKSHEQTLDLARTSLNRDSLSERDFTHITMAINPKKIAEAKELIRKFQDDIAELLEAGEAKEVYRFSTQLFPLSQLNK